jgi:hypothetical protein
MRRFVLAVCAALLPLVFFAQETLVFDQPECAGISGFRAHWDRPIPLAPDGTRVVRDSQVKDRGQTAVWGGEQPAALSFDAIHRHLLVRFPGAAEQLAAALAAGKTIVKAELVLPHQDEEIWPPGRVDFPTPDGYRYRMNWDCDNLYRGVVRPQTQEKFPQLAYREQRPNWHAVAWALRQPWQASASHGPTYNAAIAGAVYWQRFGASDPADRYPTRFGPAEVSSYHPEGRLDITALLTAPEFGADPAARLRQFADCGLIVAKQELYDARYFMGAYEFTPSVGGRAIIIQAPQLVVTLQPGAAVQLALPPAADIAALARQHQAQPKGAATAVVPTAAQVAQLNERFLARPTWMPEWQYAHVRQLMGLESEGRVAPFYYRLVPDFVAKDAINRLRQQAGRNATVPQEELDYAVYLAWLDWNQGRQLRTYEGHLTAADSVTQWYSFRDALPAAVQDTLLRNWDAWLMPDRESAPDDATRKDFNDTTGRIVHPMVDDPRVGFSNGQAAQWNQGDTYYRKTGDWRGNKSFFRSGFTAMISTANFNSTAVTGALLCGQIIGSERAMADGQDGLMKFPFWLWTWNAGVGQEYIDHYYWSIATAGNKLFADYPQRPQDRMAGWSIIEKTTNDLAIAYHPGLRKLIGPASRTYYEHVLGQQDGIYHILHVLSRRGALCDVTGGLPAISQDEQKPISAWGHDYPPDKVAQNSLSGPWADLWLTEWVDDKPLPWYSLAEKKVVAEGDLVTTWFGQNYGLASIRATGQRIQVQGKWRRQAQVPESMRELGSLDILVGFNQTTIGCDGEGVISRQGDYRIAQHRNKLVLLARPNPAVIARQAGEVQFGQKKRPAQEITSVQCTVALFNFQQPQPTWTIRVDGAPVTTLPATAKTGQLITIQDGVSYLAIRPLPTTDLGRDAEVTLEPGQPHTQAYHEQTRIQAALQIHANFYRRATPIPAEELEKLKGAHAGFVVEMGDEAEYGSFAKFEEAMRQATVTAGPREGAYAATYTSGGDTLVTEWAAPPPPPPPAVEGQPPPPPPAEPAFTVTVNGTDPYATLKTSRLWQDTTLSQMGLGQRLEKAGAVITRGEVKGQSPMLLQVFPAQQTYVCTNPVPGYSGYRFQAPGGITILADGLCSMGQWAIMGGRDLQLRYAPFELKPEHMPEPAARATALFVTGLPGKPQVTLNGQDLGGAIKAWQHNGASGWLIPLAGSLLPDAELATRFAAANP